ncbi:uncharacterized protein PAC_04579 [Phialocephala subalpina]|uniref:Uncharacterized protein n=1 Tax=Phialocephala subalpina TaxID=576137 RepID=A0A1L7WPK0_9HELO|nr:uncharacterized protein PAC_04579 [Phialocephala subalpina]
MAAWRLMTPMADRLEILLLIQQHNERCPAPNQQISLNLTEDEKYRLKILEEEQDSIKRNHNEVQGQAYFLFTFLDEVLGFNPKIRSYDRHNFITATKELLRNLEEEKLEDEKKDRAAKRAILRAKAMAEDANVPDSLEQTAEQSYREAVKKVEASRKRIPRKSQNPGDIATTTKTSPTTNGNKTGGKKVEDFMSSPTKSKHNVPYPAGQSDCQSSKENINAAAQPELDNLDPSTSSG